MPNVLQNTPTVDLTHMGLDALDQIELIENVSLLIATTAQASALARIETRNIGSTVYLPEGVEASVVTGMTQRGGDSFAVPDAHNKALIVTGALVVTSPVTESRYRAIHVTGGILAPYGSENALGAAITSLTGAITYYRYVEGQQIKSVAGNDRISAESLANSGEGDVLMIAGQLIVTGQVTTVGYSQIIVAGQCIAPRSSEPVLGPILSVQGQTIWYGGTEPRTFSGDERFGADFFTYVDEPLSLILMGDTTIEPDVAADVLKAKVADIALLGNLRAPKVLHGILQYLTTEKHGQILDVEDA